MFPLSVGDWGKHRNQGKVLITDITPYEVYFDTTGGDTIRISMERAIEMITPLANETIAKKENINANEINDDNTLNYQEHVHIQVPSREWSSRPYQTEALKSLSSAFNKYSQVILALPTGSGKTFVAAKWICDHIINCGGKVIWVAHRTELLDQAYATFLKLLPPHLSSEITWWAGGREKNPYGRIVLVSIMAAKTFPSITTDILVIDEAHHEPAQTYQAFQEKIEFKKNLGLTATPKRLDAKVLNYEAIAYQKTFMSLVHEKWLACPDPVLSQTGMVFDLDVRMDDFSEESLTSLDNDPRNEFIVKHWMDNSEKYGKTLVFALNRDHARRLTESFRQAIPGKRIDYIVSGEGNLSDRNTKVSLFRNGMIDVLINCKIFTEGFDCPDVKTIFLTRPTLSVSLYLQMIGRGTRITPIKSSFYLVDFQDDLGKFQNQLIRPWVLGDELNKELSTTANKNLVEQVEADTRSDIDEDLPNWLKEDITLSPIDLNLIAGYVIFKHESGREDGFLVHVDDEDIFLKAWVELNSIKDNYCADELGTLALNMYKILSTNRLSLQGFLSAAIALASGNSEYIKLNSSKTLTTIFDFLNDIYISQEEESDLKKHSSDIYAIIKFTIDEIDESISWSQIFENEKYVFDKATNELTKNNHLRGLDLKNKIACIYNEILIDTHLLEFEWERFCLNMIKNKFSCILYLP